MFSESSLHADQADFQKSYAEIKSILNKYCIDCHNSEQHEGGLDFERYKVEKDILIHLQKWFSVIDQVETGVMPPEEIELRPNASEKTKLVSWIRTTINDFDYESVKDPGKSTLRRLNRSEYNNTVRDLTGVDFNAARYFSGDGGGGEGFDNNAEGMSIHPLMVEKYFKAARDISRHAVVSYGEGIRFNSDPSPTLTPRSYHLLAERKLSDFYNDFIDMLPKYDHREDFEPYLKPAMRLALVSPEASHQEIYDTAIKHHLMPGVFYKWYTSFAEADKNKGSRWNSQFGHWVIDPWIELYGEREDFAESELKRVSEDFTEKTHFAKSGSSYRKVAGPSMEVKAEIKENSTVLFLSVGDMGDGNEYDHVVFHNPQVTLTDGTVVYLGDLELIEHQGTGNLYREQFPDGQPFVSAASGEGEIEHGFYIEAPALLSFKLPAGVNAFNATMGMEKTCNEKGSVQVYASDEEIPFPEGKHTHASFFCGPGETPLKTAMEWWGIYADLIGYGRRPGAKEMIDVSLGEQDKGRLDAIRREIQYAQREPIKKFFSFVEEKDFGHLLKTKDGEMPALSDLANKDRSAPCKLSEEDQKQWNALKEGAEEFQGTVDEEVRTHLLSFAEKVFRRPVRDEEVQVITDTYRASIEGVDDFQKAAQLVIQSLLTRPQFLFRIEHEGPGQDAQLVDDIALANRLSYFLWSSMPDETLMELAKEGRLQDDSVLESQVRRMLKDPKSMSLSREFASQWLGFRKILSEKKPDPKIFPSYTKQLEESMYQEAIMVFDDIVKQDKSVLEILDSKTTFLNESLANHYNIQGVKGDHMRQVELKDDHRGGFLSMGSMLVATSFPGRTSPVARGQWILDALIGGKVPPPPENLELDESKLDNRSLSKKERLAAHRNNFSCSVCHDRMDPLGFSLENFDAIGRFRSKQENGQAVDAIGELKSGQQLQGVKGLKEYLATTKKDSFLHQIAQKSLGFALGRSLEYYDESVIRASVISLKENEYRFSAMALTIVKSYPFRYKREQGYITDGK